MSTILKLFVSAYRTVGSSQMGGVCRFEPSCSVYAQEALQKYPPIEASKLIVKRLCRCHPWGPFGHDPVPPRKEVF